MNVKADAIKYSQPFAFIPEFLEGEYSKNGFYKQKITRMQVFFCRFCQYGNSANDRENLRKQIEHEVVIPFIEEYKKEIKLYQPEKWKFYYPIPMFDANEVSIMLQFDYSELSC